MKDLFNKEDFEHLSVNFILNLPQKSEPKSLPDSIELKDQQTINSKLHQNKNKRLIGGFYKSITRLIEL